MPTITGLIDALRAVGEIMRLLTALVNFYREAKLKGWIKDGYELAAKIEAAKTDDERAVLARQLFH